MIGISNPTRENRMPSSSAPTVRAQLTGLHARSEPLIEVSRQYDRNRVPQSELDEQVKNETVELIRLQEKLGCQPLSDGALGWKDQLRPITQCMGGLAETTRYSRWYDTNTFYQKPIVTGRLALRNFELNYFFQADLSSNKKGWSVAIPGPWTLSELSENKHYSTREELLLDYARVLRAIVDKLVDSGVSHVQLSEPSLVYWPYREDPPSKEESEQALNAIRLVVEKSRAIITVHTFFGDANPILPSLLELPIDAVGVDLYETRWDELPRKVETRLVLGIVDSEESLVEDPNWVVKTTLAINKRTSNKNLALAPNTDLKFVPRQTADLKLESLATASSVLSKQGAL